MVRTVTDIINDAIDNKAYMPLLRGDKCYRLPVNPFVPILFADWTQIMPVIYQRAQTDSKIKYDFVQNLWLLANGIPKDTTIALGVFYYQILHENQGRAGFKIDRMRFINCFKKRLPLIKHELLVNKQGTESQLLHDEIMRYQKLFKEECNINT